MHNILAGSKFTTATRKVGAEYSGGWVRRGSTWDNMQLKFG